MNFLFEQLPLAVQLRDDNTFESFYAGDHGLLLNQLQQQLDDGERYIYLFGSQGSGRSHLLQAACQAASGAGLSSVYLPLDELRDYPPRDLFEGLEQLSLVCLDDIHQVIGRQVWEEQLFHLFNRLSDKQVALLVSSDRSVRELHPRLADLDSRLSWGSVYQLQTADDEQRLAVFQFRAGKRGIVLEDEVARYIYHRCQRDMNALLAVLDKLDLASITEQRRVTIPFVKSTMAW